MMLRIERFEYAHIVPVSQLEETASGRVHMCLAHLVDEDPAYASFYRRMAADLNKHVILDNGAAEAAQLGFDGLLEVWKKMQPTEAVLPDVLFDSFNTIRQSADFLDMYMKERATHPGDWPHEISIMAVPQGKDLGEWLKCASILITDKRIKRIGVSKFVTSAWNNLMARFDAVEQLADLIHRGGRKDLKIHLLGLDEGPAIVGAIVARHPDLVLSCDSAFAYLAAQNGEVLDYRTIRPKGEIDFLDGPPMHLLVHNMAALNAWTFNH